MKLTDMRLTLLQELTLWFLCVAVLSCALAVAMVGLEPHVDTTPAPSPDAVQERQNRLYRLYNPHGQSDVLVKAWRRIYLVHPELEAYPLPIEWDSRYA